MERSLEVELSTNRFRRALGGLLIATMSAVGAVFVAPQPAAATPPADHVLFWNDVLLRAYREVGGAPGPLARAGAMMHVAIYDAVHSIGCE
ncbi:hypothetical protein AB0M52_15390, partial [Micromonospora sp. NPDC051296]